MRANKYQEYIMNTENLNRAREILKNADAVFCFSGAGMSAPSGANTFRGDDGFWRHFPPYKKLGLNFEQMATPASFVDHLDIALGFYGYRYNMYNKLTPHAGYYDLKRVMDSKIFGGWMITTNVDGHAIKAGFENVYESHGSIHHWQCSNLDCANRNGLSAPPQLVVDEETMTCNITNEHYCGCLKPLRPNIVMFWDLQFCDIRTREQYGRYLKFRYDLEEKKTFPRVAVLEIGAGDAIPTMRIEAHQIANEFGTRVIRINMEPETETHDRRPIHLQGDACEVLKLLTEGL